MVEISKSGSGEDLGWVTGPGYSTKKFLWMTSYCLSEKPSGCNVLDIFSILFSVVRYHLECCMSLKGGVFRF